MAKTKTTYHSKLYMNEDQLANLNNALKDRVFDILNYFDIKHRLTEKYAVCACPIHGGDNSNGFNLYYLLRDSEDIIHYKCRSHHCENVFGSGLLSLIRGILSNKKYGWKTDGDQEVSFPETLEFACKLIGQDLETIKGLHVDKEAKEFNRHVNLLDRKKPASTDITRELIRSRLQIPAKYYLNRGYKSETLDMFDVGECYDYKKSFYKRAVVPIYDENDDYVLGLTARSIYERCGKCSYFHQPDKDCRTIHKWINSKGLEKEKCLYNYGKAKQHILDTNTVIVTESPGNVWRIAEAGLYNCVGTLGSSLSNYQKNLLDESGALTIIYLRDNDTAGELAAKQVVEKCQRTYRVIVPDITKDIDSMLPEEILELTRRSG